MSDRREFSRLEEAIELWLGFRRDGGMAVDAFLAAHADLRDLLEPLATEAAVARDRDAVAGGPALLGGDFELLEELGRGGMGVVFAARQRSLDRRVAVKVLADPRGVAPRSVARFRREATTAARLRHPHIVDVIATGSEPDGTHWFAMELVDGEPLDRFVAGRTSADGTRDLRSIVELVALVADALHHAHEAGVLHRDVKPSNVLVTRRADGTPLPVLTDFGLARELDLPSLSRSGELTGTPYYVSPEQARGSGDVDRRTDVFSLGVTLFEVSTGTRPFEGATSEAVLRAVLEREPPDPRRLQPTLPRDLAAILLKALEKEPARRYATAGELAADLRRFLEFRPVLAKRASALRRVVRGARREPVRAALIAVLAVAVPAVAVLLGNLWSQRRAAVVGERVLRRQTVEDLLLDAARAKFLQDAVAADAIHGRLLELAGDEPTAVVETALYFGRVTRGGRPDRPERALAVLDAAAPLAADEPAIRRLRAAMLDALGRTGEAAAARAGLGEPATPLDLYVAGRAAMDRVRQGDDTAIPAACEALRRAVLRSRKPDPALLCELYVAAFLAGDEALERDVSEALVHLWPGAPAAWVFRCFYFDGRDDARAAATARHLLAVEPDFWWAHFKLGELAHRAADLDTAAAELTAGWQRFDGYLPLGVELVGVRLERGEPALARPVAEQLAELVGRRDAEVLGLLATVQRAAGDAAAADRTTAEIRALDRR
ncbi:MAG: serine/threonine protein kinase [Planctomycetes bacterium]|nr:serine/threonine protein kinase [Planctomycetota bacterium]